MTGILQAILSFFGVAPAAAANYIEDVFSTYLYTGTGSSQTITNNIDTSTKGGLVWIKGRSGATGHRFTDTVRGATKSLESNSTAAEATESTGLTAFGTTGFTIGADADYNTNAATYVSWTFREQAKFFDVVTWTGNGVNGRAISHSLGSTPGAILVKCTSDAETWFVWHRSRNTEIGVLNATDAFGTYVAGYQAAEVFGNGSSVVQPTSTNFTVAQYGATNQSGRTYVAYLFAHDAGGFGASGSDNVISCGSFTTDGSGNATVSLGYEPQWVMTKRTDAAGNWTIVDVMRGMTVNAGSTGNAGLYADSSGAEIAGVTLSPLPNATGMTYSNVGASRTFIYIAIRRGPMKTPTSGTSVFTSITRAGTGANATVSGIGFNPDLVMSKSNSNGYNWNQFDRLRGRYKPLFSSREWPEDNQTTSLTGFDVQNGYTLGADSGYQEINFSGQTYYNYHFGRAPKYFDIVAYSGSGSNTTQSHNLSSVPELMFVKIRNGTPLSNAGDWQVYSSALLNTEYLVLNSTNAKATGTTRWNSTTPTSTVFSVGTDATVNGSGNTYVAYLFATCAGVSKVGSYTGTGTTLQVDCGFTAGARFVMIKRTDFTGDWYVWDSAQGIVAGNDPYLRINSSGAQVTNTDYVDTYSAGFEISSTAPAAINANGGTYIFLAIA